MISPNCSLDLLLQGSSGSGRNVLLMAKTKIMSIINRSSKLISIQHERRHSKGSKNSSFYFDDRIDIGDEADKLIGDERFDKCI